MELGFIAKGFAIGFSIAAPVGPIGILCIRRSLADGMAKGFAAGLGAALRWEPSRGGDLFPHLYEPLATASAVFARPQRREDR